MKTTAIAMPDTQDIDTKAMTVLEVSRQLIISNDQDYTVAADFLKDLKTIEKSIDETFDAAIKAAHDAHKAVLAAKAKHAEPVKQAEGFIKSKLLVYQQDSEKRRKQQEEEIRAAAAKEAEDERIQKAERLIAEGKAEEALLILEGEKSAPSAVILPPSLPKVKGVTTKKVLKVEVYDLMALIKAVAAGAAPANLIEPDMAQLTKLSKALGEHMNVPGVRLVEDAQIAVGGR